MSDRTAWQWPGKWEFSDIPGAIHFSERPYVVTTYAGCKAGMRDAPPTVCGSMA